MSDEPGSTLRRRPQQARGQARVALILDAAEALYAEVGAEAATTNAIAARAGASVGSLYQFFPNKDAILTAAAARYQTEMLAALEDLLATLAPLTPVDALVDRFVGVLELHGGNHIGVTRVVLQSPPGTPGGAAAAALRSAVAERLDALLALRMPEVAAAQRTRVAHVALTALLAILALGISAKDSGAHDEMFALFQEARALLGSYLQAAALRH